MRKAVASAATSKEFNLAKLLLVALALLTAHCNSPMNHRVVADDNTITKSATPRVFSKYKLAVESRWLRGPFGNVKLKNQLMVLVFDNTGTPTSLPDGLTLNFYSTMPSMVHPLEDAGFFEEVDTGVFINKDIQFNMGDEWRHELWLMNKDLDILDKVQWFESF